MRQGTKAGNNVYFGCEYNGRDSTDQIYASVSLSKEDTA